MTQQAFTLTCPDCDTTVTIMAEDKGKARALSHIEVVEVTPQRAEVVQKVLAS